MSISRERTTKELASRIDPTYVRRQSGSRWVVIIASICIVAAAVGWWYIGRTEGMYGPANPGHVSVAHAGFQNDCAQCHDNDGKGGFRAAVYDSACWKCHPAAGHAPTELLGVHSRAHHDLPVMMKDPSGGMRSANCVTCHIEHEGDMAMAAKADAQCAACHQNLDAAIDSRHTRTVALSVTEFNGKGAHPYFGRDVLVSGHPLPAVNGAFDPDVLYDPTVLLFNHQAHISGQGKVDPLPGAVDNCTVCHVTDGRRPSATQPSEISASTNLKDGRYMRPINFVRDCEVCHPLSVAGGARLPHIAMDLVLNQVSNPAGFFKNWLDKLDKEKKASLLGTDTSPEKWVADTVTAFAGDVTDWASGLAKGDNKMKGADALENVIIDLAANAPDKAGTDMRVVTAYVAYGANKGCAKCHEVKSLYSGSTIASQPSSPLLTTVPTGIPKSPRRWFRYSIFDHQSHQETACVRCHERSKTSTETCDVLSPNLNWKLASGELVSCADCHRPKDDKGGGAKTSCVECHLFHEPSTLKASMPKDLLSNAR